MRNLARFAALLLALQLWPASIVKGQPRTSAMCVYGVVHDIKNKPVNGVLFEIMNLTTGLKGEAELPTPASAGVPGLFFVYLVELTGRPAARSGDVIRLRIRDPSNRLGRAPRLMPNTFQLGPGDVTASRRRIDPLMY